MLRCPRSIVLFGLACCLAASGCQTLDVETALAEAAPAPSEQSESPELSPETIALLASVQWQRTLPAGGNPDSALTRAALADHLRKRRYRPVVPAGDVKPAVSRKQPAPDDVAPSSDGTADRSSDTGEAESTAEDDSGSGETDSGNKSADGDDQAASGMSAIADADGDSESGGGDEQLAALALTDLERVAATDTLAGWNAAILIAYRNPEHAAELLPVLQRLVRNPPAGHAGPKSSEKTEDSKTPEASGETSDVANADQERADELPTKSSKVELTEAARLAAVEAWCLVLARGESPLESLAPAARLLEDTRIPVDVQRELLLAIARDVSPVKIPGLAERFPDSVRRDAVAVEDRRTAIQACVRHAIRLRKDLTGSPRGSDKRDENTAVQPPLPESTVTAETGAGESTAATSVSTVPAFDASIWPAEIWNCQMDRDPIVRQQFGLWLVLAGHERAFALLRTQVTDVNTTVAAAAMHAIGLLGTPSARDWLKEQAAARQSRSRLAAIRALAEAAGTAEIAPFAADDSPMVRRVVAGILKSRPSPRAVLLMRPLLLDADPHVADAALNASEAWPDEFAIPLWLTGMRDSLMPGVRQRCFELIRGRRSVSEPFLVTASLPEREQMIAAMIEKYDLPAGILTELRQSGLHESAARSPRRDAEIRGDLQVLLTAAPASAEFSTARRRLTGLQPADVTLIEKELESAAAGGRALVLREILPSLSPVYQALQNLSDADVIVRRRAAGKLSVLAESGTLSPVATRELHAVLSQEADSLVWRFAMAAVMPDGTREAASIAQLALHHRWPDIRVLGCEYVGRHGQPERAHWLLPLLADGSRNVRMAAIDAAGRCQHPILISGVRHGPDGEPLPGLTSLLTSSNAAEQFAASVSLARLGDERGTQELIRRSYERDAKARAEAVRAMGQTGRSAMLPPLMELAWTEDNLSVRRAILKSLNELVPESERPPELSSAKNYDAQVRVWRRWWELKSEQTSAGGTSRVIPTVSSPER